ncbi:MAG: MarC family protein [Cryomorphaceae bacterium]|nr:MarC family protein [Cryomorphaceae bacterium]
MEASNLLLVALTSFFTLMNPLGIMPVFLGMTATLDRKDQIKTATKAMTVAFLALLGFAFSGQLLFSFFGISVDSFRVVGGILFFLLGQDMLQARLGRFKIEEEKQVRKYVGDIAVTPLAIPMICGPGAITNAIVLMEDANTIALTGTLIVAMLIVCFVCWFVLVGAGKISNLLGDTGTNIMMRLMGLIVMVIAVEFFFSGLTPILQRIFNVA